MSYIQTNWKKGDIVTSAKLNKLENGVAACYGCLKVSLNSETEALDKTWKEIYDALADGKYVNIVGNSNTLVNTVVDSAFFMENTYTITASSINGIGEYSTDSENGYPVLQGDR